MQYDSKASSNGLKQFHLRRNDANLKYNIIVNCKLQRIKP